MTTPADQRTAAFAAWFKSAHNQIAALVALAIIVAGFVAAPESKLEKLGHALAVFGATPVGAVIYAAIGALVVAVLRWALSVVPKGAAAVLVLALAAGPVLVGCTGDALAINAGLASTMADVVNEGCSAVEHERDAQQLAAANAYETREAAAAAVSAIRDRWDTFIFACQLAARAQLAWAGYLAGLASSGGEFRLQLALPFVTGAVHAYEDFAQLDPPLPDGVHLPAVPGAILSLLDALTPTEGAE